MSKTIEIFVDGSYTTKNPDVVGWGIAWITPDPTVNGPGALDGRNGVITKENSKYDILTGRQIGGEIKATMEAVHTARGLGYEEVVIKYDYDGIPNWALGEWKRNKQYTRAYHEWMSNQMQHIKVTFVKVNSGDNPADAFARKGTGAESAH